MRVPTSTTAGGSASMIVLRGVLCATGLERPAQTALRYAFLVAERFNAALNVVHAREFVQGGKPNLYLSNERMLTQLAHEQHSLKRLDALVRAVPGATGRAATHVLDGTAVEAVLDCCERHRADLIVLGGHAPADPDRSDAHASVAQLVGSRTLRPVLTVPRAPVAATPRIDRILCPIEWRYGAPMDVVAWAVLFARRFGAAVDVLHTSPASDRHHGAAYDVQEALRVAGVGATSSVCPRNSSLTAEAIRRSAEGQCDLIVIGATQSEADRSPISGALRRSCAVPTLSVRSAHEPRLATEFGGQGAEGARHSAPS